MGGSSASTFNMREGPADGEQDLNFWTREMQDVVREVVEDPILKVTRITSLKWTLTRQVSGCLAARLMLELHSRLDNWGTYLHYNGT